MPDKEKTVYLGNKCLEEEVDIPIPNAVVEVFIHTLTRGAQVGGIIFPLITIPISFYRRNRGAVLLRHLGRASLWGSVIGASFVGIGTYQKLEASTAWGIYDRAYRLRNNHKLDTLNKISYSSASLGLFLGSVVLNKGMYGGAVGFTSGLSLGALGFLGAKLSQKLPRNIVTKLLMQEK